MKTLKKSYINEIKKQYGYYPTWLPGTPLKLGAFGLFKDDVFSPMGHLDDFNIDVVSTNDLTSDTIKYNSKGSVSFTTKLSGKANPKASALVDLDAGLVVEFEREHSIVFQHKGCTTNYITNSFGIGQQIIQLYKEGQWEKDWVIITDLVTASSSTILISNSSNSKVELRANANIEAISFDIADAEFKFDIASEKGISTSIVGARGLTPLYKVKGIKTHIFSKPDFAALGITAFDLLTPENAATKYADEVSLGYITSEQRA